MKKLLRKCSLCFDLLAMSILVVWEILEQLWETVQTVPTVTLTLSPASVQHGDTVTLSGQVFSDTGVPAASVDVALSMTDIAGTETDLGTATTDATGKYSKDVVIAVDVAPGSVAVSASALGQTAQATFTHIISTHKT